MKEKGQALIILIVAIALTLSVLTASLLASISQAKASSTSRLGQKVYYAAESGAEYGLLKSLRNPGSCTGSETLNQDSVLVTITYTPSGTSCVVTSEAIQNNIPVYSPHAIIMYDLAKISESTATLLYV